MKKLVPGILALLMCFGCLAGCGESESPSSDNSTPGAVTPNPDDSTPDEDAATLDEAATALSAKIDLLPTEDRVDYSLPNSVFVAITKFTVTWEVECATDGMVSLTAGTTETNVTVSKSADETTAYTLKATITAADGTTKVVTFDCSVLEAPAMMPDPITDKPVEGVDYKLYVYQTNPSANYADCYFDGEMSGWYFRTSSDYNDAVDMHVEYIAGTENFNISFTQKSTNAKKYIYVETGWNETNNHEAYNVKIGDTPTSPFYWDAEKGAMLTTIPCRQSGEGKEVTDFTNTVTLYLGNYKAYTTFQASEVKYLGGEGNNVGGLVTMKDKSTVTPADKVAEEKEKLVLANTNFTGEATITLPTAGTNHLDVVISWSENSDLLSIEDNVLTVSAVTAATEVTLTATLSIGDVSVTKDFTLSLSSGLVTLSNPVEGKAYNLLVQQNNLGKVLYLDGTDGGRYLNTTEDASNAVDVYVEAATGGYKFYILNDNVKNYLVIYTNSSDKTALKFTADDASVFTYNAETNAWVSTFGSDEYGIGTYSTYDTVSASFSSYTTAENTGIEQFPVEFIDPANIPTTEEPGSGGTEEPDPTPTPTPETTLIKAAPAETSVYKLYVYQSTLAQNMYFNGAMSGYYFATTQTYAEGVDIYVEYVDETSFNLFFMNDGARQYIGVRVNGTHNNIVFDAEPVSQFVWNADLNTITTTISSGTFYLGNYSTYNTFSASTVDKASTSNVGGLVDTGVTVDTLPGAGSETPDPEQPGDGTEDPEEPVTPTYETLTIPAALTLGASKAHNTYTEEQYYVEGIITSIYNTTYGNMYIVDEEGNQITVYGLLDDAGKNYGSFTGTKPVVGDKIKVLSVVGQYSNAPQLKNALLVEIMTVADSSKVAVEKNTLTFTDSISGAATLDLATAGALFSDVAIAWEVTAGNDIASIADGKLVITNPAVDATVTVTVKATITCNESTDSVTFDIAVTYKAESTEPSVVATFEFGANGSASHADGSEITASKSYTEGAYTLTISSASKVYDGARDAKGNSCLKFGTSKVIGEMTFTVPENVTSVVIYAAKYKNNVSKVNVNGTDYTLAGASDNGVYDAITVDTTTTKTITFKTVASNYRCMINTIEFIGM